MAFEDRSCSNEPFNFIIYDTISATPFSCQDSLETNNFITPEKFYCNSSMQSGQDTQLESAMLDVEAATDGCSGGGDSGSGSKKKQISTLSVNSNTQQQQGRKKRRRKPRVCKNKEEAETQRMTHIAVERNRRKQMNEHLAILRALMPDSYVQRGDQASIVGGAIEFVKELEHLLQSLEAQKLQLLQHDEHAASSSSAVLTTPFLQLLEYPQYSWSHSPNKYTSKTRAATADIEVTLIETHANLKILSHRISPRQHSKLVAGIQSLQLTILHLTVNTMDPFVLYSISVKIEEGCLLSSVDDIAAAIHHMLRVIEEAALC